MTRTPSCRRLYCTGAALALVACCANAQGTDRNVLGIAKAPYNQPVPADRPSFGDSAQPVPKGYFEMEGGLRFDNNQGGGDTYTLPSDVLLRTGLTDNIELRLGFDGYDINAPGTDGVGNALVGFKIHLHDEGRYTPEVSIQPSVSLPVGDDAVASAKAEPEVDFVWSKDLSDNVSLGGNINLAERNIAETGNRRLESAFSIASNYEFTDRLSGYAEYYAILPEAAGMRDTHAVDGGFAFLATRHTQFDAYVGRGLNHVASNVYAGFGVAHLF